MTELAHHHDGRACLEGDRGAARWAGGFNTHRLITSRTEGRSENSGANEVWSLAAWEPRVAVRTVTRLADSNACRRSSHSNAGRGRQQKRLKVAIPVSGTV